MDFVYLVKIIKIRGNIKIKRRKNVVVIISSSSFFKNRCVNCKNYIIEKELFTFNNLLT